jgi:hemoglobin-like flavoprotein
MPTQEDIALVRASFANVVPIKDKAADLFYARLFEIAPQVRALFPSDLAEQKSKLVAMMAAAVAGIDDLPALVPVVKALGARHVGYGATPAHFEPVGQALLWTLRTGLADAFTPEVEAAWTKVYGVLAATMQAGAAEAAFEYDKPSTLLAQFHDPKIDEVSHSLDDRLAALLGGAAR